MKSMAKKRIKVGDEFQVTNDGWTSTFRREADDPKPAFKYERMRVTCLSNTAAPGFAPYTFPAEPDWFVQRGLEAE